jgi:hypothetical protein
MPHAHAININYYNSEQNIEGLFLDHQKYEDMDDLVTKKLMK